MLKTCIGTDRANAKDYKDYSQFEESKVPYKNGNGDIFHGRIGGELQESLDDLLPEEIPGIPRHRPGEFSPRYGSLNFTSLSLLSLNLIESWVYGILLAVSGKIIVNSLTN
jgi:hypothetical protein